jgi:predicted membrane metal-binding protein
MTTDQDDVQIGSEKGFGIVFAVVFLIVALWPLPFGGEVRLWALAVAALLLVIAFAVPRLLSPFNRVWFRFGLLLHKIVNPVIMGLIFFGAVLPTGFLMRLFGKDPLRLGFDREAASYWIDRDPPGPDPSSMRNQF